MSKTKSKTLPFFGKEIPEAHKPDGSQLRHRFDADALLAVETAIAAGRPLLLKGEPGIGKSQLAFAMASVLRVPFYHHVVDERTERDDLLYRYDAVRRLAKAQVLSVLLGKVSEQNAKGALEEEMAEQQFITPGVLWNAFRPSKEDSAKWEESVRKDICGSVALIDEIDKADPSVPNGLLEALGNMKFLVPQTGQEVTCDDSFAAPLVVITSNDERELPPAFLRRCVVYRLPFPTDAVNFLLERAAVYWTEKEISTAVRMEAAELLLTDRKSATTKPGIREAGMAEYLDMLRVLVRLHPGDTAKQLEALNDNNRRRLVFLKEK